jgi:hypothetical protein
VTPTWIEPATYRLVAQYRNQLRHRALNCLILYKTLDHTPQKISVAIADEMLSVQDSDNISDCAQNDTKLDNILNENNIQSVLRQYVLLPPLFNP